MKKHIELIISTVLVVFTIYFVLDTLVIKKTYQKVEDTESKVRYKIGFVTQSDFSYQDNNLSIKIKEFYEYDTKIYVADVSISDPSLLRTAFAQSSYGKNIVDKTSVIAEDVGAILAVNGDFYGAQEKGYVLRNGVIYRELSRLKEDLVIYKDGSFGIINERETSLKQLLSEGAYNVLSFGPTLVKDSEIAVMNNQEVRTAMASNPRTAIGIISKQHYAFVVSDGRTRESVGLSLYQLAQFMKNLGCKIAYNLDGGGSSTMYFSGKVINKPTSNGTTFVERSVSDIVYVGY